MPEQCARAFLSAGARILTREDPLVYNWVDVEFYVYS